MTESKAQQVASKEYQKISEVVECIRDLALYTPTQWGLPDEEAIDAAGELSALMISAMSLEALAKSPLLASTLNNSIEAYMRVLRAAMIIEQLSLGGPAVARGTFAKVAAVVAMCFVELGHGQDPPKPAPHHEDTLQN